MGTSLYRQIQYFLTTQIQQGSYQVGDYLPSENELCRKFSITRTTVRKALDELQRNGFIERHQGIGSRVAERGKSLGLLNVKGFSEAVGQNVETIFLQMPEIRTWPSDFPFSLPENDPSLKCIHFERLRCVNKIPVMLENNWVPATELPGFTGSDFVEGSFFKTLSQRYHTEVIGSEQELRALQSEQKIAEQLMIPPGSPVLEISIRFSTSNPELRIYSQLYCNTATYPIGNSYFL
jgi:GntR family transcriptional regulator/GntR family frlABCD operon transcriptional regulator